MAQNVRFLWPMQALRQDLRYAARALRRTPGFTAIAILLLTLGIGANMAVFSVVHAVLLRPLPYPEPDHVLQLERAAEHSPITVPEYEFTQEHASTFASIAAYRGGGDRALTLGGSVEWINVMMVTTDFLRTLGVAPALGREFLPEETRTGGPQAVILSDALWRRAFAASPQVVGRVATLNDASYTVAGVLPANFWFPQSSDALIPLPSTGSAADLGTNSSMIARLKPGITLSQAEAEMRTFTEGYRQSNPRGVSPGYRGLMPVRFQDSLSENVRTNLLLLFGAVALLLLITCSNLASLLLARLTTRQREIAVCMALGSSAGRVLRQFLLENFLLTAAGGVAGWLVASWLLEAFLAMVPFRLPSSAPIGLNVPVLAFTLALAAGANLFLSLAPFLAFARMNLSDSLKSGNRAAEGGARQLARSVLVAGEVALSVTLLVSAALLIQSLYRLRQEQLGFSPRGVMTFWTPVSPERRGKEAELRQFEAAVLDRIRTLPGVTSAAAVNMLPLTGPGNFPTQRDGHPEQSVGGMEIRAVTPAYFETMGISILRGRGFSDADDRGAPPVILVSEGLARRWWSQDSPLGDRVVIGMYQGRAILDTGSVIEPRQVIGVVADTKRLSLKESYRPTVYVPAAQWDPGGMNWVVRGNFTAGFADPLRRAIAEIDPRQRVERVRSMEDIVASTTADSRFDAWLFGIFAGLALVLTAAGVYGLLSFSMARRTREIGTRMALGASRAQVLGLILKQGLTLLAVGLAAGLAGARALTGLLSSLLFGVRPTDRSSYVAVAVLLFLVGVLASYVPARRATKVDPVVALRTE